MTAISSSMLLDLWERGRDASPGERGLLLLAFCNPNVPLRALEEWNVGQRDAALLAFREGLFGTRVSALATCPHCGEQLELDFLTTQILAGPPLDEPSLPVSVAVGEYRVDCRLPTAGDLAALAAEFSEFESQPGYVPGPELPPPVRWLLERCVTKSERAGVRCPPESLPDQVLEEAAIEMPDRDERAEVELAMTCPGCRSRWACPFDIVTFLWHELASRAEGLLEEVSALAAAFGWSERTILELSPTRRRHYLELAGR
jgi:hypothetical protein